MLRLVVLHHKICDQYHYHQLVLIMELLGCFQNHVHIVAKCVIEVLLRQTGRRW